MYLWNCKNGIYDAQDVFRKFTKIFQSSINVWREMMEKGKVLYAIDRNFVLILYRAYDAGSEAVCLYTCLCESTCHVF